jgi:adenylylsulfate kinase
VRTIRIWKPICADAQDVQLTEVIGDFLNNFLLMLTFESDVFPPIYDLVSPFEIKPGFIVTVDEDEHEVSYYVCNGIDECLKITDLPLPDTKATWLHTGTGNKYEIYDFTNSTTTRKGEYPTRVSYKNLATKETYSRSVSRWFTSMRLLTEKPQAQFPLAGVISVDFNAPVLRYLYKCDCGEVQYGYIQKDSDSKSACIKCSKQYYAPKALKPCVLWFTGRPSSGKTTLSRVMRQVLLDLGHTNVILLDGDELRASVNKDLGFDEQGRWENVTRVMHMANLLVNQGSIVLVAIISPHADLRYKAKELVGKGRFAEIYCDASFEACSGRDPKGLYRKALTTDQSIAHFTGLSSLYEGPTKPDILLDTENYSLEDCANTIVDYCFHNLIEK